MRQSHLDAMNDDEALVAALRSNEKALRRFGVLHLAIFGSRARGDHREDSDLDVLIELVPQASGQNVVAATRKELEVSGTLSNITGLDVSLLIRDRLPPELAGRIRDDLIPVF